MKTKLQLLPEAGRTGSEAVKRTGQQDRSTQPFAIPGRLLQRRLAALFAPALAASLCLAPAAAPAQNVQFLPSVVVLAGVTAGNTGTTYSGEGGPATSATFGAAIIAAVQDSYGNTYVLDTFGTGTTANPAAAVRRVDAVTGVITTYAGGSANGAAVCAVAKDAIGNGCPATQATFNAPQGIRFYKGDLYIADTGNNEIRVVNGVTGIVSIYAGTSAKGLTVPGLAATATVVTSPEDINFDAAGNGLTITANGFPYVLRIDAVTGLVSIVAGTGAAGTTGDGGLGTAATIQTPVGVTADPQGNVYFSSTTPQTIRKITIPAGATTGIISTYAGTTGTKGSAGDGGPATSATLSGPGKIDFDALGNLYIADQTNAKVRIVNAAGVISTYVGTGTAANSASGTVLTNANLNQVRGVAVNAAGDLVIADGFNRQAKLVTPPVNFPATAVGATAGANAGVRVNTALTEGRFNVPPGYSDFSSGPTTTPTVCGAGMAVAAGSVCIVPLTFSPTVAGTQGALLQFTDANGNAYTEALSGLGNAPAAAVLPGLVNPIAGTGTAGNTGNGGPATAARLNAPSAVAFDALGNYFFADTANNQVREVTLAGNITAVAGTGAPGFAGDGSAATSALLNAPSGLAVDGAGNVYIADTGNNRIRLVSNGTISTFAGTGIACNFLISTCGNGGPAAQALLNAPQGLFLTPSGVLYVADTGDNVIRTIGLRSTGIVTLAGTGVAGFSGDTSESAGAQFRAPRAVTVDNGGNIYVADTGNNAVRLIHNGTITTYAGATTAGFSDGASGISLFRAPSGLAVDAAGALYVADTGNHAIRRIALGQVLTVAGTGTAGFTGNGTNSNLATFSSPLGVGLDTAGNVVIADTGNNALRAIATASSSIAYPNTSPNTTSAPVTIALSDSGNQPLAVAGLAVPAGFAEQASGGTDCNAASLSLAPGASCQASLVFKPTNTQSYAGNAVITDNAQGAAAAAQTIALSGVGAYVYTAAISAPAQVTAGKAFSLTVSVTNPIAVYGGTVQFTTTDPSTKNVLPSQYTFTAADNGTHTFTGVLLSTAGTDMITVSDVATPSIKATAVVTVSGGPAASLVIVSGNLQTANIDSAVGRAFTLPLVVEVLDSLGNPSAGASVTFTAPSTTADASFPGSTPTTFTGTSNARGLVTSPLLTADQVTGTFAVTVTTTGAPSVAFSLTNTSSLAPGFAITSNPPSLNSVAPGTTATAVLTITPQGGFNAAVNVSCVTSAPQTTCTLSAATVAASGNGTPTTFNLALATTGPATTAMLQRRQMPMYAGFVLLSLGVAFRKRRRIRNLALGLLCCLALGSIGGCGSSNLHADQTFPGTYSLQVTGTSGSISYTDTIPFYVAGAP